jgi:hypothetical protein
MSLLFRYVGDIIGRSIAVAMKPRGGRRPGLIRRSRLERCGSKRILISQVRAKRLWRMALQIH